MFKILIKKLFVFFIIFQIALTGCSLTPSKNKSAEVVSGSAGQSASDNTSVSFKQTHKPIIGATFLGPSEFPTLIKNTMISEANKRNIDLFVYDGNGSAEKQISDVKDMILKKADVIILNPADATGCVKCVELADAVGIPVLGVNANVNTDKLTTYVGSNDLEAGEIEMTFMAEKIKGEGNIVVLDGIAHQSSQVQRSQGILNALRGYPHIKILDEKSAGWSRDEGYNLMKEFYEKYGDSITAVVSQNDEMALGAVKYLTEKKQKKIIPIIGVDAIPDAIEAVKSGKLDATVFQDAVGQGKLAVDLAVKIFNGETVARTYYIPFKLVTKENVGQYITN